MPEPAHYTPLCNTSNIVNPMWGHNCALNFAQVFNFDFCWQPKNTSKTHCKDYDDIEKEMYIVYLNITFRFQNSFVGSNHILTIIVTCPTK